MSADAKISHFLDRMQALGDYLSPPHLPEAGRAPYATKEDVDDLKEMIRAIGPPEAKGADAK